MHGDHVAGLYDGDRSVFPNAEMIVSEAERAFWDAPEQLSELQRGQLEMARKGVRRPLADDLLEVSAELPASARAAAWAALAGLRREAGRIARPRLVVAPAVARWLDGPGRPILDAERARLGHLEIAADPALGRDVFRVEIED
jgi:glyoxylase-like metal-dependent hydrolase (beta-lactamase superfamily II)